MPVQLIHKNDRCFTRWGNKGAEYEYECGNTESLISAKKKAIAQGVAIGNFSESKRISFDYDGVASTSKGKELISKLIDEGNDVYIILARDSKENISVEDIPDSKVFATGSNSAKIEKIKELNIDRHYDDNLSVVLELGYKIGRLFEA